MFYRYYGSPDKTIFAAACESTCKKSIALAKEYAIISHGSTKVLHRTNKVLTRHSTLETCKTFVKSGISSQCAISAISPSHQKPAKHFPTVPQHTQYADIATDKVQKPFVSFLISTARKIRQTNTDALVPRCLVIKRK